MELSNLEAVLFEHRRDSGQVRRRLGLLLDLRRALLLDVVRLRLDLALGLRREQRERDAKARGLRTKRFAMLLFYMKLLASRHRVRGRCDNLCPHEYTK